MDMRDARVVREASLKVKLEDFSCVSAPQCAETSFALQGVTLTTARESNIVLLYLVLSSSPLFMTPYFLKMGKSSLTAQSMSTAQAHIESSNNHALHDFFRAPGPRGLASLLCSL